MALLSLYSFPALLIRSYAKFVDEERGTPILTWTNYALCILFFLDFIYVLVTSENRKKYMMTWGWIDLISCIPTFGWGRIARIIRILKLLYLCLLEIPFTLQYSDGSYTFPRYKLLFYFYFPIIILPLFILSPSDPWSEICCERPTVMRAS